MDMPTRKLPAQAIIAMSGYVLGSDRKAFLKLYLYMFCLILMSRTYGVSLRLRKVACIGDGVHLSVSERRLSTKTADPDKSKKNANCNKRR